VRIAPPLNIGDVEIDEFARLFADALASVSSLEVPA
jgi:acetylornithine/succinyldiaminopimelate/putrescine aminotransferase